MAKPKWITRTEGIPRYDRNLPALFQVFRDVTFCLDKRFPWDGDDSLIRTAGCTGRQVGCDFEGNVSSNDGEVTVFELEDVGAALQRWGLRTVLVRVGTNSA